MCLAAGVEGLGQTAGDRGRQQDKLALISWKLRISRSTLRECAEVP